MSTSDSYSLQKELPEPIELEAWNKRDRERIGGLHKRMNFPFQNYQTTFFHTGS